MEKIEEGFFRRWMNNRRPSKISDPETHMRKVDKRISAQRPDLAVTAGKDVRRELGHGAARRDARLAVRNKLQSKSSAFGRALSGSIKSGLSKVGRAFGASPKPGMEFNTNPGGRVAGSWPGTKEKGTIGAKRLAKYEPNIIPHVKSKRESEMNTLNTLRNVLIENLNSMIIEARGDTLARRLSRPEDPDYEGRHTATEKGGERSERAIKSPRGSSTRKAAVRGARANKPVQETFAPEKKLNPPKPKTLKDKVDQIMKDKKKGKKLIGEREDSPYEKASDEALDKKYGYGRSTGSKKSFGRAANRASAASLLKQLRRDRDAGKETSREEGADAVHKGWSHTARTSSDQTPEKKARRAVLADTPYFKLSDEEKEKDRVSADAVRQVYANRGKK